MNRRDVLRALPCIALGAGTAGCLGETPGAADGPGFPTIDVEEDPTEEGFNGVVDVLDEFGADSPAEIEVAFVNDGDGTDSFPFGQTQPLSALGGERVDGDGTLFLHPEDDSGIEYDGEPPTEPDDGCWQFSTESVGVEASVTTVTLDPGESVSMTYDVYDYDEPDSEECLAAGEYRVEAEAFGGFEWGFTLTLAYES